MYCRSLQHNHWSDVFRDVAGLFFVGYAVLQVAAPLLCAR